MKVQHENLCIECDVPIAEILTLEFTDELDTHGKLEMQVIIDDELQMEFFSTNYQGKNLSLYHLENDEAALVFNGHITDLQYDHQTNVIHSSIVAFTYSTKLDITPIKRTFQDVNRTYQDIIKSIVTENGGKIIWNIDEDLPITRPFFQYDETDWTFIKRLSSHLGAPIQINLYGEKPDCYIGIKSGRLREISKTMQIESGFSKTFFQNNGYRRNEPHGSYLYIKVKHKMHWQLGDYTHQAGQKYTIIKKKGIFSKGELYFIYTFGAAGFLKREIIFSNKLKGLSLQGIVKQTEHESVQIQLFIDELPEHDHYWPWTPEIGNLGYVMPEVGSRVVLTLITKDEKDALATHLLRFDNNSPIYELIENKQMQTAEDKLIGLYPEEIMIRNKDADSLMQLLDATGINIKTNKDLIMRARGQITINGNQVNVATPNELLIQTSQSNVKIEENFNIFAPADANSVTERRFVTHNENDEIDDFKQDNESPIQGILPSIAQGMLAQILSIDPALFASHTDYSYDGGSIVPKTKEEKKGAPKK